MDTPQILQGSFAGFYPKPNCDRDDRVIAKNILAKTPPDFTRVEEKPKYVNVFAQSKAYSVFVVIYGALVIGIFIIIFGGRRLLHAMKCVANNAWVFVAVTTLSALVMLATFVSLKNDHQKKFAILGMSLSLLLTLMFVPLGSGKQ